LYMGARPGGGPGGTAGPGRPLKSIDGYGAEG